MTGAEVAELERIIRELEGDVGQARTRDEHMRLTRQVLQLRRLLEEGRGVTEPGCVR